MTIVLLVKHTKAHVYRASAKHFDLILRVYRSDTFFSTGAGAISFPPSPTGAA